MSKNPHVIKLMLQLNQAIHKVFSMMNKYLDGWRRYDTVYNLWNPKRKQALDKLAEKKHTCVYFDTRIASYELLAETVRAQPSEKDVDFIRIDCYPVALGIAAQADQWKTDYGAVLHQCSSVLLEELCAKMTQVSKLNRIISVKWTLKRKRGRHNTSRFTWRCVASNLSGYLYAAALVRRTSTPHFLYMSVELVPRLAYSN